MNRYEFETAVETAAAKIVNEDAMQFYFGTLFVKCTSLEAAKIETILIEALSCGVIVSKVGPEYCFDFTE